MAGLVLRLACAHLVRETRVERGSLERDLGDLGHGLWLRPGLPALPAIILRPNRIPSPTMDALKAQIAERKRKATDTRATRGKYSRRGELNDSKSTVEYDEEREDGHTEARESPEPHDKEPSELSSKTPSISALSHTSANEISARLRNAGEPIRLFAETEEDRATRLREAELREKHASQSGRADYLKALEGTEVDLSLRAEKTVAPASREGVGMDQVIDLTLLRKDPAKLYPMIYYTLKGLMADWETELAKRPEDVRLSTDGRLHTAAFLQSSQNIKPLFKLLRRRALEPDVLVLSLIHI